MWLIGSLVRSLDPMILHFRNKEVIKASMCFVNRILARARSQRRLEQAHVRVFLAGCLMVYHPNLVFQHPDGTLEVDARTAMSNLLDTLFEIEASLVASNKVSKQLSLQFSQQLEVYLPAFHAWKDPDSARLRVCMRNGIAVMAHLRARRPPNHPLTQDLELAIARFRARYAQLGGQAGLDALDADLQATMVAPNAELQAAVNALDAAFQTAIQAVGPAQAQAMQVVRANLTAIMDNDNVQLLAAPAATGAEPRAA